MDSTLGIGQANVCQAATQVGQVGVINDNLNTKLMTLTNFDERLKTIVNRLYGQDEPGSERALADLVPSPTQASLHEVNATLERVEGLLDRIRDRICRLEEL